MKNALCLLLLTLCLFAAPKTAAAQYMTGKDLVASCDGKQINNIYKCIGYVAGVIDYHVMMQSLGTAPTTDFCLPQNASIEMVTVVVINYLKKSPQHGDFIAAPAVTMALHDKFPCAPPPKKKRRK